MLAGTRIAEIAIGEAQRAQRKYLDEPVENDGDTAKKHVAAVNARSNKDKDVVDHHQCYGQDRSNPQDVKGVGQRYEPPLRRRQIEDVTDHDAEDDEVGQKLQQQRQPNKEAFAALEAQIRAHEQSKRRRERVM